MIVHVKIIMKSKFMLILTKAPRDATKLLNTKLNTTTIHISFIWNEDKVAKTSGLISNIISLGEN